MPRVLVLTYHWPPLGGSGVQHPLNVVRRLPEHGWEPVVVTGPGEGPVLDPSLAEEQPVDAEVHRVPGTAPDGSRLASLLMRPSAWQRWWISSLAEAAARVRDVDAVYAWAQPYATLQAAARLGKPWVADLSDPWALDEMWFYATAPAPAARAAAHA